MSVGDATSAGNAGNAPLRRARALMDIGRDEEAAGLLARHLTAEPDSSDGWCLLALCRNRLDDPPGALAAADAALRADPGNEHAWRVRSSVLVKLRRHEEAIAAAAEAVRLSPGHWATHSMYAHALSYRWGGLPQAYAAAVHSAGLAPEEPEAHFRVGVVAQEWGKRDVAERAYRTVLGLDPGHALARNNLGVLTLRAPGLRRPFEAAEHFAASLAADPQSATARRNVEAALVTLLSRARWRVLACLVIALISAAWSGAGRGHPPHSGALGPRAAGLTVIVAVWAWWGWRVRAGLPERLRPHMRSLFGRSAAVAVLAAGLLSATLIHLAFLAVPWKDRGVEGLVVMGTILVPMVTNWAGALLFRRRGAARRQPCR